MLHEFLMLAEFTVGMIAALVFLFWLLRPRPGLSPREQVKARALAAAAQEQRARLRAMEEAAGPAVAVAVAIVEAELRRVGSLYVPPSPGGEG
ncbi:hypothetical protein [Streptomyces sp. NPDC060243]|uniref:hypothetical protein n=1 Tax=Streptomyces sp. NPDC060243 TaxID=3347081 RepID=UPI0036683CEC